MLRDTLFISHATPEDNEFSIWLASRLEMLGYKTWLDKNYLLGGEHMWQDIQEQIQNHAAKVLFVYSSHINDDRGILKEGIQKELYYAESIAKQNSLKDFIIPLNIDPLANFNEFIGANMLTQVIFHNWAEGLEQLLRKLNQENVPFSKGTINSSLIDWYENRYISKCAIEKRKQDYYSSLWEIKMIPEYFYIYKFYSEKTADEVFKINTDSVIVRQQKNLITFNERLNINSADDLLCKVAYEKVYKIKSCEQKEDNNKIYPNYKDCNNALKALLNNCFRKFFLSKGLLTYGLSSKKTAYYFSKDSENITKVKFTYPLAQNDEKVNKTKGLVGIFDHDKFWHYGMSYYPIFSPVFGVSLKSHLIFTSDGKTNLFDVTKQHSYRRKKGKRFFNEEWRDMLLAFLETLKNKNGEINFQVSPRSFLVMEINPCIFSCDFDYIDPNTEMSEELIDSFYYEGDESDD